MKSSNAALTILSYGLGWDSTAILLRWLLDPSSRDFDLSDLVVVTAMTGDEFKSTGRLVEQHILPLLREHGVRYIQVARSGPSLRDGVTVLDDSRSPERLYLDGAYRLSDEMLAAATVPQFGGARLCSQKQKGVPLDHIIEKVTGGHPFRHVMGFNADEVRRVTRDASYSTVSRRSEYPLLEWGWGRLDLEAYVRETLGVEWEKSCCTFCPFAGSCKAEKMDALTGRYAAEPGAAVLALTIERRALALNVRQTLFASGSLRAELLRQMPALVARADAQWDAAEAWTLYRVRRTFRAKGQAYRSLQVVATGTRGAMMAALGDIGPVEISADSPRVWNARKGDAYPTNEEMHVVAPAGIQPKEGAKFRAYWVRTARAESARAAGIAADHAGVAAQYVAEWAAGRDSFTKGACMADAAEHGVFRDEASAAFDAADFARHGRRYVHCEADLFAGLGRAA